MDDRGRASTTGARGSALRVLRTAVILLALAVSPVDSQPQWQTLPGAPITSRIDDLHFLDPLTGWIATGDGTIHATNDGGISWSQQYSDATLYFRCIRFADPQRGWAGTLITPRLLYATTNGGATWNVVTNVPEPRPNALCGMWAASSQVVYGVGSYAGPARVIKTSDGGATWSSTDLSPLASTLVDVYFANELEGVAVGSMGTFPSESRAVVLKTTDGGATWQRRHLGWRLREWGWKITFPSPDTGYVTLERPVAPRFVLKTVDRGLTWSELPFEDFIE